MKKAINIILSVLLMFSNISFSVSAQEEDPWEVTVISENFDEWLAGFEFSYSENCLDEQEDQDLEELAETDLKELDDIQGEWVAKSAPALAAVGSSLYKARRVTRHYLGNGSSELSYISMMYVDGNLAYCLEPYVLIPGSVGATTYGYYGGDAWSYSKLTYDQKMEISKTIYYGYGYGQDYSDEMFVATQLEVWRICGYPNEGSGLDCSWQRSVIRQRVADNPSVKRPSFSGSTIKLTANQSVTLTDTNQVLNNYAISNVQGISLSKNNNQLTITLNDANNFATSFAVSGSDDNLISAAVIWQSANYQTCMSVGFNDPTGYFTLNFELDAVKINLIKEDSETITAQGEGTFEGAEYRIESTDEAGLSVSVVLDKDGKATIATLPAGKYQACEIKAPQGYKPNEQCVSIDTTSGKEQTVSLKEDVIKNHIELMKLDKDTQKPLSHVFFEIVDSQGRIVDKIETMDGKAVSKDLPYGHYTVNEISTLSGYVLSEKSIDVMIEDETSTYTYQIDNQAQKGQIRINKLDANNLIQGDSSLKGAVFEISAAERIVGQEGTVFYEAEEVVETATIDESFSYLSGELPLGKYKVKEVKAGQGYQLNPAVFEVSLTSEDSSTLIDTEELNVINEVIKGKIMICKTIDGQGELVEEKKAQLGAHQKMAGEGFEFDIILKSSGEVAATLVTDENGIACSEDLPYGLYTIQEKEKEGFETIEPFDVMIEANGKTYNYMLENKVVSASLTLVKVDKQTGKVIPASGVSFQLFDHLGNLVRMKGTDPNEEVDTFVTDESGSVTLPEVLWYGHYQLKEMTAPAGYVLNEEEIEIVVDGKEKQIYLNVEDEAVKGKLLLEKKGESLDGFTLGNCEQGDYYQPVYVEKGLAGAVFEIIAAEAIIGKEGTVYYHKGEVADTLTTTETVSESKELPLGKYLVKEKATIPGYVLDEKEYPFELTYENQNVKVVTTSLSLSNQRQKVKLSVTKEMEESLFAEEAFRQVVFGIYNSEAIGSLAADSPLGYFVMDQQNETIELPCEGNYYLKELQTHPSYMLLENPISLTVKYGETNQEEIVVDAGVIENKLKRGSIHFSKVDEYGNAVTGCTFELSSDEDFRNIVKTFEVDQNGQATIEDLEIGTYYLREIDCDEIFELNPTVVEVEIDQEETEVIFTNYYRSVDLVISKETSSQLPVDEARIRIIDVTDLTEEKVIQISNQDVYSIFELVSGEVRCFSSDESILSVRDHQLVTLKCGNVVLSCVDKDGNLTNLLAISVVDQTGHLLNTVIEKVEEPSVCDFNTNIVFEGKSGHQYLHLVDKENHNSPLPKTWVSVSDKNGNELVRLQSDQWGCISLDGFEEGDYQISYARQKESITVSKKSGELVVSNLKYGRKYMAVEVGLPYDKIYSSSAVKYVLMDSLDGKELTMINEQRKIDLKVVKVSTSGKRLNGAVFTLGESEAVSGGILLKNTDDNYYLGKDEAMNEVITLLKSNSYHEILEVLEEGEYYLLKQSDMAQTPQKVIIEKGVCWFKGLDVGEEVVVLETEACSGYYRNEEEIKVVCHADFLTSYIEIEVVNKEIPIVNCGDE